MSDQDKPVSIFDQLIAANRAANRYRVRLDQINEHMKDAAKMMEEGCDIDVPDIINECIELSKREESQ